MAVTFTPTTVTNPVGVQSSYPFVTPPGHEGMLVSIEEAIIRSYVNQESTPIPFGAMVQIDNSPTTNEFNAVQLAVDATLIQGIVVDTLAMEGAVGAYTGTLTNVAADGRLGIPSGRGVQVLRRGVIWVYTTQSVAMGDPVRYWDTDFSGTTAGAFVGRFCTSQSTTRTCLAGPGFAWASERTGAGLVQLEVNLPNSAGSADA
jgi:hypothetical protein